MGRALGNLETSTRVKKALTLDLQEQVCLAQETTSLTTHATRTDMHTKKMAATTKCLFALYCQGSLRTSRPTKHPYVYHLLSTLKEIDSTLSPTTTVLTPSFTLMPNPTQLTLSITHAFEKKESTL